MRRGPLLGCAGALAVAALAAWLAHGSGGSPLQRTLRDLTARTTPPGGESWTGAPERRGHAVEAAWEVRTEMEWPAYREWVRGQLSDFRITATAERSTSFARWLGGDAQHLTIEIDSPGPPVRARVTFTAYPD
jgi:hypothetical protein